MKDNKDAYIKWIEYLIAKGNIDAYKVGYEFGLIYDQKYE